jgi:hypothetical protein
LTDELAPAIEPAPRADLSAAPAMEAAAPEVAPASDTHTAEAVAQQEAAPEVEVAKSEFTIEVSNDPNVEVLRETRADGSVAFHFKDVNTGGTSPDHPDAKQPQVPTVPSQAL